MNKRDRELLWQVKENIGAVPGVKNPMDTAGMASFYHDMSEVRAHLLRIMTAMLDGDPDYAEDNRTTIEEELRGLKAFIDERKAEKWGKRTKSYRFIHTT